MIPKNPLRSQFLDEFYNDTVRLGKYKKMMTEFQKDLAVKASQAKKMIQYTLPLGFQTPMLLAESEEKAIAAAILQMARSVNEGKYLLPDYARIIRFDVSDENQRDVPMPYIKISFSCDDSVIPKHGLYFRGIFKKEKVLREITEAKITRVVFLTKDRQEFSLMDFK